MDKISCPVCFNEPNKFFHKGHTLYSQCANCKTVFCEALDQDNKIGGKFEVERNQKENHLRIARVEAMFAGRHKDDVVILDYGCGNGLLIEDFKKSGFKNVDGFDPYTEKYRNLPEKNKYNLITCIECIEHTSKPYFELDVMYRSLVNGGVVIVETSFTDIAEEEGIPINDFFYCSPQDGHSTIFSHHSLDLLFALKGFKPFQHSNRHVRIFTK